jgi:hypothetical protein
MLGSSCAAMATRSLWPGPLSDFHASTAREDEVCSVYTRGYRNSEERTLLIGPALSYHGTA